MVSTTTTTTTINFLFHAFLICIVIFPLIAAPIEGSIPPNWAEINNNVVLPYKVDSFPRPTTSRNTQQTLEVWCYPASTQRCFNAVTTCWRPNNVVWTSKRRCISVVTTLLTSKQRCIDFKTTSCAYWVYNMRSKKNMKQLINHKPISLEDLIFNIRLFCSILGMDFRWFLWQRSLPGIPWLAWEWRNFKQTNLIYKTRWICKRTFCCFQRYIGRRGRCMGRG